MKWTSWQRKMARRKAARYQALKNADLRLWTRCVELGSAVHIRTGDLDAGAQAEEAAVSLVCEALEIE